MKQAFCILREGETAKAAFDELVNEAKRTHGDGSYNGTISTTEFSGVTKFAEKYSEKIRKEAEKYVSEHNFGVKWYTKALDLGVCGYRVTNIEDSTEYKTNPVYALQYCVTVLGVNMNAEVIKSYKTKAEAVKAAKEYALKNGLVLVRKEPVLQSGDPRVVRFSSHTETVKAKPKAKKGQLVKELHMFLFFRWASC